MEAGSIIDTLEGVPCSFQFSLVKLFSLLKDVNDISHMIIKVNPFQNRFHFKMIKTGLSSFSCMVLFLLLFRLNFFYSHTRWLMLGGQIF